MRPVTQVSNSSLPWHRHPDPRIVLILDGKVSEREAFGIHSYAAGEFVFRPPFHLHANDPTEPGACYVRLPVSPCGWRQLTAEHNWSSARGRIALAALDLERLQHIRFGGDILLDKLAFGETRALPANLLERQLDQLADDMTIIDGQSIRLDERAEQLGLQKYQLTRKFRERFGMTPSAFHREVRLSHALSLLQNSHWALSRIAVECGFSDQSHLSRSLSAATGRTPAQMRELLR